MNKDPKGYRKWLIISIVTITIVVIIVSIFVVRLFKGEDVSDTRQESTSYSTYMGDRMINTNFPDVSEESYRLSNEVTFTDAKLVLMHQFLKEKKSAQIVQILENGVVDSDVTFHTSYGLSVNLKDKVAQCDIISTTKEKELNDTTLYYYKSGKCFYKNNEKDWELTENGIDAYIADLDIMSLDNVDMLLNTIIQGVELPTGTVGIKDDLSLEFYKWKVASDGSELKGITFDKIDSRYDTLIIHELNEDFYEPVTFSSEIRYYVGSELRYATISLVFDSFDDLYLTVPDVEG